MKNMSDLFSRKLYKMEDVVTTHPVLK